MKLSTGPQLKIFLLMEHGVESLSEMELLHVQQRSLTFSFYSLQIMPELVCMGLTSACNVLLTALWSSSKGEQTTYTK